MDVSRICRELVAIRSENPPGRTAEVIEYIRIFFDNLGIRSDITRNQTGQCNLVTKGLGNRLFFCGHVDVVPALDEGWTHPPFSGVVQEGFVWGRGATDMKGGCASLLCAVIGMSNKAGNCLHILRLSAMKRRVVRMVYAISW